uniref:Proteasome activator complex subunit 1 n=1 Tax=Periophthalmus magnuspinnatus TaxID=409849 RepID=A0A3B4BGZ1_9GOBI
AEELVKTFFPQKIEEMQLMLTTSFICKDLETLKVLLDIPMPDPAKEEAKRKKKEPPCGPICVNETVDALLKDTKRQISTLKEKLNTQVSLWMQLQVPKVEDGNNFGVAVQEKVFELLTNTRTKIEAFQTLLGYSNERGDAVAKAAKSPHVGDYRALVHQLDQFLYCELRLIVLEIRNIY